MSMAAAAAAALPPEKEQQKPQRLLVIWRARLVLSPLLFSPSSFPKPRRNARSDLTSLVVIAGCLSLRIFSHRLPSLLKGIYKVCSHRKGGSWKS